MPSRNQGDTATKFSMAGAGGARVVPAAPGARPSPRPLLSFGRGNPARKGKRPCFSALMASALHRGAQRQKCAVRAHPTHATWDAMAAFNKSLSLEIEICERMHATRVAPIAMWHLQEAHARSMHAAWASPWAQKHNTLFPPMGPFLAHCLTHRLQVHPAPLRHALQELVVHRVGQRLGLRLLLPGEAWEGPVGRGAVAAALGLVGPVSG